MSGRIRVLLVEDDYAARTEMAGVLRDAGYDVLEASDGERALCLALSGDPAVILLDLILPDGAGFDLVQELRDLHSDAPVPIVAVSGFEERIEDARSAGVGFDGVLLKPFGSSELLAAIADRLPRLRPDCA
jgi:DNA-binding response OmpR family regulator